MEEKIQKIYESYLDALRYANATEPDAKRRHPGILKELIKSESEKAGYVKVGITGSKGKGSIARMCAAALIEYEPVGLFVSPHVLKFNERISVGGCSINDRELSALIDEAIKSAGEIKIDTASGEYYSPIGLLSFMAARYFNERYVKAAVFELGKGARYDDVNSIDFDYSIIGSIFLEHKKELGQTVRAIAEDKAHIIKGTEKCVYCMEQPKDILDIIEKRADKMNVPLKVYGRDFDEISTGAYDMELSLYGSYQKKHASISLMLAKDMMSGEGRDFESVKDIIKRRICEIRIPGRMDIVSEDPFIMIDSSINRVSAKETADFFNRRNASKAVTVLCIPDGKDFVGTAKEISAVTERFIVTKTDHPHYPMETDRRMDMEKVSNNWEYVETIYEAINKALNTGLPVVILCANTFVAEIRKSVVFCLK